MLRNQIKFFVRIFLKDKFFSTLNILGLALGIAVSIILLLILQNDLTYDQYHEKHKRIYRLGGHLQATGVDGRRSRTARELGAILKEELPEIQAVVRANNWDHTLVKYESKGGEKAFYEEDIVRTDSTYFQVFTHQFIAGDPNTCLTDLNTLVITESKAKKYFGDEDPINKSLIINNQPWKVTAVIRDLPANTHLKFDILLSRLIDREWVMDKGQVKSEAFWNPDVYMYLLMPEHYNPNDFERKFASIFNKYFKAFGDQVGGKYTPILEPLADIHFHSDLDSDEPHGNIAYLYAFTGIGVFIILLACINYMNLSTAKSVTRATEIAMKKTLGSGKRSLVVSFLGESVFLSFISLALAIVLVFVVLRLTSFNQLIDKNLAPDFLHNPLLLFGSLGIALGIGIISGLYPAFYLPAIPTLHVLKGTFKNRKSSHVLRRVLITTQFAISIFVVVCTLFMQDQIDYVRSKDLGFDKENVLLLPIQDSVVENHISAIKNEFLQNPHITAATTAYNVMGIDIGGSVMWAESETGMKQQSFSIMFVGDNYMKTMGMKLASGRDFQPGPTADIQDVFIANEAASKLMGWGNEGVGKKVKFFHAEKDGQVIGIVKDFNFNSLHNAVEPLLIIKTNGDGGFLHLRVQGGNLPQTISYIREKWTHFDTTHPFEYSFLDQRFNEQYKADEVQYKLLSGLSYICIFISLLGLLGLSAFSATQRTKEIGVRKVLGATISNIIFMLSKDVLLLVIVAAILVAPVSYWVMNGWMSNFAYRTELNYLFFIFVTVMALGFVFLTVAFHSMKTARTNPTESLRTE
ncbi:MAG TPA: FtsX-like permease family protein [Cyclobacteriaceae bacterium]|nr:FtsX-like permease family protein [Cyclobacteriaceae bacterium]